MAGLNATLNLHRFTNTPTFAVDRMRAAFQRQVAPFPTVNEVKIQLSTEAAEGFEAWLFEQEASPWSLFQAQKSDPFFLQGYFPAREEGESALARLAQELPTLDLSAPNWRSYADSEWQEAYKQYLRPWQDRGLHWVPLWMREEYGVPSGEVVFYFDAGMAFGTGCHGTTRLCARRLLDFGQERGGLQGQRIVDAGCGSGILAISAALLGGDDLYGFDYDPEAIRVSQENLAFNGLPADAVTLKEADLAKGLAGDAADLILANILANVLMPNAEALLNAVKPGGWLVLSGILADEANAVKTHFAPLAEARGFTAGDIRTDGEWSDCRWVRR